MSQTLLSTSTPPGSPLDLASYSEPHFLCCVLLKKFFRDLPQPLFGEKLFDLIGRCPPVPPPAQAEDAGDEAESGRAVREDAGKWIRERVVG